MPMPQILDLGLLTQAKINIRYLPGFDPKSRISSQVIYNQPLQVYIHAITSVQQVGPCVFSLVLTGALEASCESFVTFPPSKYKYSIRKVLSLSRAAEASRDSRLPQNGAKFEKPGSHWICSLFGQNIIKLAGLKNYLHYLKWCDNNTVTPLLH